MKNYKRFKVPAIFVSDANNAAMAEIMCGEGLGSSWVLISEMFIDEIGVAVTIGNKIVGLKKTIESAGAFSLDQRSLSSGTFFIFNCDYDVFTDWLHEKEDPYFLQSRIKGFEDVMADFRK